MTDRSAAQSRQRIEQSAAEGTRQASIGPSLVELYTTNLKELFEAADPVTDYSHQIRLVLRNLSVDGTKAPILIGETSLTRRAIEGLAQRLSSDDAPAALRQNQFFQLNLRTLLTDAKTESDLQMRLSMLLSELRRTRKETILFLQDIATSVNADASRSDSVSRILEKMLLATPHVQIVASEPLAGFESGLSKSKTLAAHFSPIYISGGDEEASDLSDFEAEQKAEQIEVQKISPDLRDSIRAGSAPDAQVSIILQVDSFNSRKVRNLLSRPGVQIERHMPQLSTVVAKLPARLVHELALNDAVLRISADRKIGGHGHLFRTAGGEALNAQPDTGLQEETSLPLQEETTLPLQMAAPALDGSGVGIAVIDSGVHGEHASFKDAQGASRVSLNLDFTGEGPTGDFYGHGTHVAAIAGGNDDVADGSYRGIAANANLFNLRVLDSTGFGSASNLL
ncbi:MAG TPA: S8 family serine peptidase, partial [Pyrinomonadaceae bacterium]|nr:S8 family serine peptidase [Pyrinomonadaceae bacterium]